MAVGALVLFAFPAGVQAFSFDWSRVDLSVGAAVVWWGLGTMSLGSATWFAGVRRVPGAVASVFMAVMPVSALVLSYILLGEEFSPWHLMGMGAVLAGIGLVAWRDRERG